MWKEVKDLWKVVKPREGISSVRLEADDQIIAQWFEDNEGNAEDIEDEENKSDISQ